MKTSGLMALLMFCLYSSLSAEYTGTLSENIIMTTTKGATIDLYEKLDSGMHVLFFATSAT